jgi:adenine phosphoribosyltransferase
VADAEWLKQHIRDLPDHPQPGITFRDITPLLANPQALGLAIDMLVAPFQGDGSETHIDKVVAVEARGFFFGPPVANALGVGFVPIRKPGKLPWATHREEYALEYGTDVLEIHQDALDAGDRVLIVDDVLATGGTALAAAALISRLGAEVVALSFLIDLTNLSGRERLAEHRVHAVLEY